MNKIHYKQDQEIILIKMSALDELINLVSDDERHKIALELHKLAEEHNDNIKELLSESAVDIARSTGYQGC